MADITKSKRVIKGSARLYLKTPLLLKSGYSDIFSDSTIEKTYDGENIHINGYVWSSLIQRCIGRLKGGLSIAKKIGKYKVQKRDSGAYDPSQGVSPLWCEPAFIPVNGLYIRSGNAIDRRYGAAKEGALFNDEIAPAGLSMRLNWNYFLTDEDGDEIKKCFIGALWVLNAGIENIGGGWSYGMGRLGVKDVRIKTLILSNPKDRACLWRFDDEALSNEKSIRIEEIDTP
ncbi:MAG: RAMP superfamily CRISPR-associated protein, partial [Syntrophorhabdaceae bacterium]|nr:RAMP superfamily CRISPR-associated protein [Syntrophorhabdaceae bacterium]